MHTDNLLENQKFYMEFTKSSFIFNLKMDKMDSKTYDKDLDTLFIFVNHGFPERTSIRHSTYISEYLFC